MDEKTAIMTIAFLTKIPVKKLKTAALLAGGIRVLMCNPVTAPTNLTARQRDCIRGIMDIAQFMSMGADYAVNE